MPPGYFQTFVRLRSHTTGEWIAPAELRERLVADATEQESNLTDVVISILSDQLNVPCDQSTRRTAPNPLAEELNLRIPMRLYRKLSTAAARHPRRVQREIVARLCSHYGLVLDEAPKRSSRAHAR